MRAHVGRTQGLTEDQSVSRAWRQKPGQHPHGRGLAAPVRANKAEDLTPLDSEADPIHGDEVAKPTRQVACDNCRVIGRDAPRGWGGCRVASTESFREQFDEGLIKACRAGARSE